QRDSGPTSYYWIHGDPEGPFIRGVYKPPLETVTLFADVGDELRNGVDRIRFRWRAWVLPGGGNECGAGRGAWAGDGYNAWEAGAMGRPTCTSPGSAGCAGTR